MKFRKFLMGYDAYERHQIVAKLVSRNATSLLDVGGGEKTLEWFLNKRVISVNLEEGDIRASGLNLPFRDSIFDCVTSLDVLEHISPDKRTDFVHELVRVSRKQVVVCAPHGSPEHMEGEKKTLEFIHKQGISNPMLEEHVQYGLPTLETFQTSFSDNKLTQVLYSGYFQFNILCFKIDHLFGVEKLKYLKLCIAIMLNILGNLVITPLSVSDKPRGNANRMFVVMTK